MKRISPEHPSGAGPVYYDAKAVEGSNLSKEDWEDILKAILNVIPGAEKAVAVLKLKKVIKEKMEKKKCLEIKSFGVKNPFSCCVENSVFRGFEGYISKYERLEDSIGFIFGHVSDKYNIYVLGFLPFAALSEVIDDNVLKRKFAKVVGLLEGYKNKKLDEKTTKRLTMHLKDIFDGFCTRDRIGKILGIDEAYKNDKITLLCEPFVNALRTTKKQGNFLRESLVGMYMESPRAEKVDLSGVIACAERVREVSKVTEKPGAYMTEKMPLYLKEPLPKNIEGVLNSLWGVMREDLKKRNLTLKVKRYDKPFITLCFPTLVKWKEATEKRGKEYDFQYACLMRYKKWKRGEERLYRIFYDPKKRGDIGERCGKIADVVDKSKTIGHKIVRK